MQMRIYVHNYVYKSRVSIGVIYTYWSERLSRRYLNRERIMKAKKTVLQYKFTILMNLVLILYECVLFFVLGIFVFGPVERGNETIRRVLFADSGYGLLVPESVLRTGDS